MERGLRMLSFVVPTYNERQNLPRLVEALAKVVHEPYEIIVVDDDSPDGTAELALDLAKQHPIRLIHRPAKGGLGSAYRDGFAASSGDLVFEMDADLSHDPRYVPALAEAIAEGAAVAVGSRYVEGGRVVGWTTYRRLVSWTGNTLARTILGLRARDVTSGYRCFARAHAQIVQEVESDGYAFQVEALYLAKQRGLLVAEVPIVFENRTVGKSKLGVSEFAKFLGTLLRLRTRRAARPPPGRRPVGQP